MPVTTETVRKYLDESKAYVRTNWQSRDTSPMMRTAIRNHIRLARCLRISLRDAVKPSP